MTSGLEMTIGEKEYNKASNGNTSGEIVGWDNNMKETIEFYQGLYGCKIFLHGYTARGTSFGTNIVTVYQSPSASYQEKLLDRGQGTEIETVVLPPFGKTMWVDGDCKRNFQRSTVLQRKTLRQYILNNVDEQEGHTSKSLKVVAESDTAGGIHFIDFYQGFGTDKRAFDEVFKFIMNHHKGREGKSLYRTFKGSLDRLNCEVIKEVKVITEFDAELFKSECIAKLERAVEYQKTINESKSRSLVRTLEEERQSREHATTKATHEGFKLGLLYGRDKGYHGWRYDSDEKSPYYRWLVYDKDIKVTELHYHGKKVMISDTPTISGKFYVKGLRILPTRSRVNQDNVRVDESTYHPNSSGGQVCIGDLEGKDTSEVLEKLPRTLTIGNFDSALRGGIVEQWKHLWYKTSGDESENVGLDKNLEDTHVWEVA